MASIEPGSPESSQPRPIFPVDAEWLTDLEQKLRDELAKLNDAEPDLFSPTEERLAHLESIATVTGKIGLLNEIADEFSTTNVYPPQTT
jgi:hypothetical protein